MTTSESRTDQIVVVGSGPAGVMAAWGCLRNGKSVHMIDMGNTDEQWNSIVPDKPFTEVFESPDVAKKIFLGLQQEGIGTSSERVGAQLTPPRKFITRGTENLLPIQSDSFFPMQSLAKGGLAAGWGASCFVFDRNELSLCGLDLPTMPKYYEETIRRVGISGKINHFSRKFIPVSSDCLQPALPMDENIKAIYEKFLAEKQKGSPSKLILNPSNVAILSEDKTAERRANPLHDMDFYSRSRGSVFRPADMIDELKKQYPNFRYSSGYVAVSYGETTQGVTLRCLQPATHTKKIIDCEKLILAAGAINSARLFLKSQSNSEKIRLPILSNPYRYIAAWNWRRFGQPNSSRRHSLAQLFGFFQMSESSPVDTLQFYSYRSLLLFKLAKEIPLPPQFSLAALRAVVDSLTVIGLHKECNQSQSNFLQLSSDGQTGSSLNVIFKDSFREIVDTSEKAIRVELRKLGVLPLRTIDTGPAGSIHYAGTLPTSSDKFESITSQEGKIRNTRNVYVADSSTWNYLPAKGLTLTIMANALRVGDNAAKDHP